MNGWLALLLAGVCEIIYAAAMPRTEGFTRLGPTLFALIFIAASMILLAQATRSIPVGTAYAVWVGIGAVGTAAYGMLVLNEPATLGRIFSLLLIVAGIVGLKLLTPEK